MVELVTERVSSGKGLKVDRFLLRALPYFPLSRSFYLVFFAPHHDTHTHTQKSLQYLFSESELFCLK